MPDTPRFRIGNRHPHQGSLFRTRLCKYGGACQYGERCYFAHSEDELRPRMYPSRDFSVATPDKYSDAYGQSPDGGSMTVQSNSRAPTCVYADAADNTDMLSEASTSSFAEPAWTCLCVIESLQAAYLPRELEELLLSSQPDCYSD